MAKDKDYKIEKTADNIRTVKLKTSVKNHQEVETLLAGVQEVGKSHTIKQAVPLIEPWCNGSRTRAIMLFIK